MRDVLITLLFRFHCSDHPSLSSVPLNLHFWPCPSSGLPANVHEGLATHERPLGRPMGPNSQNEDGTETAAPVTRGFGYIPLHLSFGGPGLVLSRLRHSLCHSRCAAPLLGKLQKH